MLQSQLFCRTKKEAPKDAENVSYKLLTRADFIEQSLSGVYRFLPLGFLVLKNIEKIIREEMTALGCQEIFLPSLQNKNLWEETGRWTTIDPPLFKFKDRHQKKLALGSTHEEEITDIARKRVKSYQDLPFAIFQIQNKFRNEMRATGGLLRTREFLMKDLYSFHKDEKDLMSFYEKVRQAYFNIFKRCGLDPICVNASSGTIGGELSHEFMVEAEVGEDTVLVCRQCGFAANVEKLQEGESCPECNSREMEKKKCIEVGHIFNLGTKYSKVMGVSFLDDKGKANDVIMGCYGIGLPRLMATIVEKNNDEKGIIWPKEIAPFSCHLIRLEAGAQVARTTDDLYRDLRKNGINLLYDDRDRTAGEKFADADLIGIPLRIVISERTLAKNSVEIKFRNEAKAELIEIKKVNDFLKKEIRN